MRGTKEWDWIVVQRRMCSVLYIIVRVNTGDRTGLTDMCCTKVDLIEPWSQSSIQWVSNILKDWAFSINKQAKLTLIVSQVTVLHAEIVVLDIQVNIGQDKLDG